MALCRVNLFGATSLHTEEGEVRAFGTRRAVLLLAILALAPGRRFSRTELAERLWPDDEIEATSIRLRQELMRLRKMLGPALLSEGGAVALDAAVVDSDVARFGRTLQAARREPEARLERLAQAVESSEGAFLEGFSEPWVVDERRRLSEAKAAALGELRDAAQGEEAVRWARLAVAEDPLSERASLALVRRLAGLGKTPEAIREFEAFAERLRVELDLEPSAEAAAAVAELRQSDAQATVRTRLTRTLPAELTNLYGREGEASQAAAFLKGGGRLLTLTGLGGVGKTRLAVALGARLEARYEGRVVYVPFADVRDARAMASKVLAAIGTDSILGREDLGLVAACLPDDPTLLILDNLEHLGDEAARFVEEILGRKPNLRALATSRHALRVVGERVMRLGPLAVPESMDGFANVPSVALFVERARNAVGAFELNEDNAATVVELVRRLGGLPLAIHLAASRARVLAPRQMLEQIDRQEDLLVGRGTEFATERHRSLRAAMEWSLGLLGPEERRTFAELSVFEGGWTVESATAVCGPGALAGIEELLDRSLVEPDKGMRFRMLEPLREIAQRERDESVRARHAAYFVEAAGATYEKTIKWDRRGFLRWGDAELDNLRAALDYGVEADHRAAHRLFGWIWRYFYMRGYYEEGRRWGAALVARIDPEDPTAHPWKTCSGYAVLTRDQGDHLPALDLFATAAEGFARVEELGFVAFCKASASRSHNALGDHGAGLALAEEALAIYEEIGHELGTPFGLTCLATGLRGVGRLGEAYERTARALEIYVASGDPWGIGDGYYQHARTMAGMSRPEEAVRLLDVSLATFQEIEEVDSLGRVQLKRGELLVGLGRHAEAQAALDEATRLAALIGNPGRRLLAAGFEARLRAEAGDPMGARSAARQAFACHATQPGPPTLATFLENAACAWDGKSAASLRDLADRLASGGLEAQSRLAEETEACLAGLDA